MTDCITVKQRAAIFKATIDLCRLLVRSIHKEDDQVNLTKQLLRRVVTAAMSCPGFTVLMKDDIAWVADLTEMEQRSYGQPRFANSWRHQYALAAKPGAPLDVVEVRSSWDCRRALLTGRLFSGTLPLSENRQPEMS